MRVLDFLDALMDTLTAADTHLCISGTKLAVRMTHLIALDYYSTESLMRSQSSSSNIYHRQTSFFSAFCQSRRQYSFLHHELQQTRTPMLHGYLAVSMKSPVAFCRVEIIPWEFGELFGRSQRCPTLLPCFRWK